MAKRENRPDIDPEKLGNNPFVASLKIPVYTNVVGYHEKEGVLMPEEREWDAEPYAKMFISADRRHILTGLSFRALQLWSWVIQTVEPGHDYIWVNRTRAMGECRIKSVRTFTDALKELGRYGFISACMSVKNVYFINPDMGFRGSRVKKYPNNLEFKNKES
jgi:hypothetical protein